MQYHLWRFFASGLLVCAILLLAACGEPERAEQQPDTPLTPVATLPVQLQQPPQVGQRSPVIDQVTRDVLHTIRKHGWNPHAETKGQVTGGLYINWQMDDPRQTNAIKLGRNEETRTSHDPQVDLYYLNALVQYKLLHPQNQEFEQELHKVLKLVKLEFADYNLPKGWIYFFLLRTGLSLGDSDLTQAARIAAQHYYTHWYDAQAGLVYNKKADPPNFNVEHTLNCGAALIDAGRRWNQPAWVQAGERTLQNVLQHAYNKQYHLFYNNMLVHPGGRLEVLNPQAKPSTQGNAVMALVTAYHLTQHQPYLDTATQVLQGLFQSPLWDQQYQGLFFALDMENGQLNGSYKETRGQTLTLIGLHRYNLLMRELGRPELYHTQQQRLIELLTTRFYQSTYHGFFYRVTPSFEIYVSSPNAGIGRENFFTTEAMGTALDALQQTEFSRLQV